jgi:hypothetical protein
MRRWLALFVSVGLAGCDLDATRQGWKIQATDGRGAALSDVPLVLEIGGKYRHLRTDVGGVLLVGRDEYPTSYDWDLHVVSLDGCPAREDLRQGGSGDPAIRWKVVSPDSLRRACKDTFRLAVSGPPGARIGWRVPSDLEMTENGQAFWHVEDMDTVVLDPAGRGTLRFNRLLSPFLDVSHLLFGSAGDTASTDWWIDPSDSVIHLQ